MQDIESDTGYDTRRHVLDGVFARVSQTTVCDTEPRSEHRRRYYELAFFASSSSGSSLAGAEFFYLLTPPIFLIS